MGFAKGGKGKGAGKGPKGVRHTDMKKGKGKVEKRIDPSDGNGPFSKDSFIRYHGQEKGSNLWEKAGKASGKATLTPAKGAKGKGKNAPASQVAAAAKIAGKTVKAEGKTPQGKDWKDSKGNNTAGKGNSGKGAGKGGKNNVEKMEKKESSKKGSESKKEGKKGEGKKKGKGGKKGGGKNGKTVKRIDPSDGNGPFSYDSFVTFHGEELGSALWEQAGLIEEAEETGGEMEE